MAGKSNRYFTHLLISFISLSIGGLIIKRDTTEQQVQRDEIILIVLKIR